MRRSLLTILIVAAISGWISAGERAIGQPSAGEWVRTADGWEPREAVEPQEQYDAPPIHPGVLAMLQVGVSAAFMLAFPSPARELAVSRVKAFVTERRNGLDRRQGVERRAA